MKTAVYMLPLEVRCHRFFIRAIMSDIGIRKDSGVVMCVNRARTSERQIEGEKKE